MGTYGPNTLLISCFGSLKDAILNMTGYDEWGKWNIIRFGPDYQPVNPPANDVEPSNDEPALTPTCSAFVLESEDGVHGEGFDIYHTVNGLNLDDDATFLFWSETSMELPKCARG